MIRRTLVAFLVLGLQSADASIVSRLTCNHQTGECTSPVSGATVLSGITGANAADAMCEYVFNVDSAAERTKYGTHTCGEQDCIWAACPEELPCELDDFVKAAWAEGLDGRCSGTPSTCDCPLPADYTPEQ